MRSFDYHVVFCKHHLYHHHHHQRVFTLCAPDTTGWLGGVQAHGEARLAPADGPPCPPSSSSSSPSSADGSNRDDLIPGTFLSSAVAAQAAAAPAKCLQLPASLPALPLTFENITLALGLKGARDNIHAFSFHQEGQQRTRRRFAKTGSGHTRLCNTERLTFSKTQR